MRRVSILVLGLVVLAGAPAPASADILLTPFAGVSFVDEGTKSLTYGVNLSLGGLLGIEGELSQTPLGDDGLAAGVLDIDAHATTFMVNAVARFPAGPVQPYATAGVGVIRASGDVSVSYVGEVLSMSGRTLGVNYGGGVYVFPSRSIGIRGDIRYFRTIGDLTLEDADEVVGIAVPVRDFDFWRVTGGVTFRF